MDDDEIREVLTTIAELIRMVRDNDPETTNSRAQKLWNELVDAGTG